jgi:Protein of unknown function (DUF1501)
LEPGDAATHNVIVNIGGSQSLAVRSGRHSPLVFDDPARFRREGTDAEKQALLTLSETRATSNATLEFLAAMARNATDSSDFIWQAAASYRTTVDYGIGNAFGGGLERVAARIGRADEVAVMMFREFGRRVEENGSLGTDHGTATPMFILGKASMATSTAEPPASRISTRAF